MPGTLAPGMGGWRPRHPLTVQVGARRAQLTSGIQTPPSGVAVDGQNVVHMVTFDWKQHPYYQKFNTADSPKGDSSWEEYEMIDSRKSASGGSGRCAVAVDAGGVPHVLYTVMESYKGKSYYTLTYANRSGGI